MTAIFSSDIYTQQRAWLSISGAVGVVTLTCSALSITAEYVPNANGSCLVDLSDLVRLSASGSFTVDDGVTTITKTWTYKGLINPARLVIPTTPEAELLKTWNNIPTIVLPSMIYAGGCTAEVHAYDIYTRSTAELSGDTLTVPADATYTDIWAYEQLRPAVQVVRFRPRACGIPYAEITWVSRIGNKKTFAFEALRFRYESANKVSLLPYNSGDYDTRKGQEWSFVARLDNLTAYDVWYYSDLATSSEVYVNIEGVDYGRCEVTSEAPEIPDGTAGGPFVLEFTIKIAEYDTI